MNIWALYTPIVTSVVTFVAISAMTFIAKSEFLITENFFFAKMILTLGVAG